MRMIIIVALLLVAACAAPDASEQGGETQAVQGDETQDEQQAPEESGDLKEELRGYFEGTPEYMVTYDLALPQYDGTMTMYTKDGNFRVDSAAGGVEARTIMTDRFVTCTNQDGWQCMSVENQETDLRPSDRVDVENNYDRLDVASTSSRTIAGVDARCFDMSIEAQSYEICYAPSGAMLYMSSTANEQTVTYEATDYSSSVSDSAFEPPAEPRDMQALMEQYR